MPKAGKKKLSRATKPRKTGSQTLSPRPRKERLLKKEFNKSSVASRGSTGLVPTDPLLQAYVREVHRYPILDREEEHKLAIRFRKYQDQEAFKKLVTSNLRFVMKIAYEYVHYRMKILDLIQEGNMGLVKAVQEFDPYKEVRLTTYAVWWIRSYIQDFVLKNYSLVKMGTTQAQKKLFYRLKSEQRKLEQVQKLPRQEQLKLLAGRLDVREKDVEEMQQRLFGRDVSLNAPMSSENDQEHIQIIKDPSTPLDEKLGDAEQRKIFSKILKTFGEQLQGREKDFFEDRLISETPMTLQELGKRYGFSKERARQVEEAIKEKLKQYVAVHYPDFKVLAKQSSNQDS